MTHRHHCPYEYLPRLHSHDEGSHLAPAQNHHGGPFGGSLQQPDHHPPAIAPPHFGDASSSEFHQRAPHTTQHVAIYEQQTAHEANILPPGQGGATSWFSNPRRFPQQAGVGTFNAHGHSTHAPAGPLHAHAPRWDAVHPLPPPTGPSSGRPPYLGAPPELFTSRSPAHQGVVLSHAVSYGYDAGTASHYQEFAGVHQSPQDRQHYGGHTMCPDTISSLPLPTHSRREAEPPPYERCGPSGAQHAQNHTASIAHLHQHSPPAMASPPLVQWPLTQSFPLPSAEQVGMSSYSTSSQRGATAGPFLHFDNPLPALPRQDGDRLCSTGEGGRQLIVNYLAPTVTSAELHRLFSAFGELDGARVIYDRGTGKTKGYGFVYFQESSSAAAAVSAMNGCELEGKWLKVAYSHNPLHQSAVKRRGVNHTKRRGSTNPQYEEARGHSNHPENAFELQPTGTPDDDAHT